MNASWKPAPTVALIFGFFLLILATKGFTAQGLSPEQLIAKYGAPDSIDSTEFDNPRPLIVTKWLTYKRENIRFIFAANSLSGAPPPYQIWELVGIIDPKKQTPLTVDQALNRMAKHLPR